MLRAAFRRIGSTTKNTFALVGLAAASKSLYDINLERKSVTSESNDNGTITKKVLVIPFDKMKIVEERQFSLRDTISSLNDDGNDGRPVEMEVKELVELIHTAAEDPSIVALYGTFGNSGNFSCGGYAQLEEIRNAVRVFNQSDRTHLEPRTVRGDEEENAVATAGVKKTSHAYADTFVMPNSGMEYYLASEFSKIHLQSQGGLNMFGPGMTTLFLRSALDRYGIKVDVFKHGKYKSAPNALTEKQFTPGHLENTESLLNSMDQIHRFNISVSRNLDPKSFGSKMWGAIYDYGTMNSENAKEVGFIDNCHCNVDPLEDMIEVVIAASSLDKERKEESPQMDTGSGVIADFRAEEAVNVFQYSKRIGAKKKLETKKSDRAWKMHQFCEKMADNPMLEAMMEKGGLVRPHFNMEKDDFQKVSIQKKEKIVIIHVGTIDSATATRVTKSLREVNKDDNVKSVILRVDSPGGSSIASETIFSECRRLKKPIICSMGNYAASGGYYVASNCHKIYASPSTITGSIGVFAVRPDFSDFLGRYGINVEHVITGSHSNLYSPLYPCTEKIQKMCNRNVDSCYLLFKKLVSEGRKMSMDEVERIAQGRVFTGQEAKEACLVDELGGLNRAISYAQREFTESKHAEVEVWPKKPTFIQFLGKKFGKNNVSSSTGLLDLMYGAWSELILGENFELSSHSEEPLGEAQLASSIVQGLFDFPNGNANNGYLLQAISMSNSSFPSIMLTYDENLAVQLMLRDMLSKPQK